ncbi:MAG: N-acetylmuramoyl-L-alanine amidase [Rhodobacter sp.]|nr:N-acetylmuramoyl-L-alanine amidase [Rhodobacter sp.]
MAMRLAVVIGHNSVAQGAVRGDSGESEYVFNGRLADLMADRAPAMGIDLRVFRRVAGGGYRREIERVYDQVDQWGADASIELHFNGSSNPDASGTETLSSGTALSLRLAAAVQDEMVIALGLRNRGIRTVAADDRGGRSLIAGRAPAILVEPFFGSSARDQSATATAAQQLQLAKAYLRGATRAFEAFPRADLAESRTIQAVVKQRTAARTGARTSVATVATAMVSALVGVPETPEQAIAAVQPLAVTLQTYLPYAVPVLALLAVVCFAISRAQADRIEAARLDDHDREIR